MADFQKSFMFRGANPIETKYEMGVKLPEASLKFSAHITVTDCIGIQIRVKMGFNSIMHVFIFLLLPFIHCFILNAPFIMICSNKTTTEKTLFLPYPPKS